MSVFLSYNYRKFFWLRAGLEAGTLVSRLGMMGGETVLVVARKANTPTAMLQ